MHTRRTADTPTHNNHNTYNTRSPVTSRPLNGHFAITYPLRNVLAISTLHHLSPLHCQLSLLSYCHYPLFWAVPSASSRIHSLVMGRTSSVSRRRTRAERTRSSAPLYVSITRPTGQLLRGRCLSITNTKSFSRTFLLG